MSRSKRRPEGVGWGRFGPKDQVGRMNLITPAVRLEAFREVREGRVFTLSLPLDYPGGSDLVQGRPPPRRTNTQWLFRASDVMPGATDVISDDSVTLHTQYSTQWDALAHIGALCHSDDGGADEIVFYNGHTAKIHMTGRPGCEVPHAAALGIENLALTGVQGRGVMLDLKALYGTEGVAVGYEGVMQAVDRQKLTLESGDILCVYTGLADLIISMQGAPDAALLKRSCVSLDGRDKRLLRWITDSGIAAICADNIGVERPVEDSTGLRHVALPLHRHCLVDHGIHLAELWYLGELASWLATNGRSRFLLTAPPLRLTGCVGSPVTPVATV